MTNLTAKRLTRDRRGAITVLLAISATTVIGMSAIAVETSNWYVQKAELQRVADSAAVAGTIEFVKTYTVTGPTTTYIRAAKTYAKMNGVPTANTTVSLLSSSPTGDGNQAIKVHVTKSVPLMLSRVISNETSVTVSADAYAEIKSLAPPCVEALNTVTTTPNDISVSGNVTLTGCSLWSASAATGTTSNSASVTLSGNSTMTANVYTPGSVYVGGSSAFTGEKFSVAQSAIADFIGAKSAVTTALSNISTIQSLGAPTMTSVNGSANSCSPSSCTIGTVSGCTATINGGSYHGVTIAGNSTTCPSGFAVTLTGNFTIGSAGVVVTGNAIVNFGPGTDSIVGDIDLSGQTGGCFGLGTASSTTTCTPSTTSGTYDVGTGSGSDNHTSIKNTNAATLATGPGTFWLAGDLVLTGSGNVNWHPSTSGGSTTKVAGSVTLGTATYIFGAGVYQIKADFSFANSSGSLTFNGSEYLPAA